MWDLDGQLLYEGDRGCLSADGSRIARFVALGEGGANDEVVRVRNVLEQYNSSKGSSPWPRRSPSP